MHDGTSLEEWGESLLADLLNNIIDSNATETQLHPIHSDISINLIPGFGEVQGINIPEGLYTCLVDAFKKKLGFNETSIEKPYLLADFKMEVAGIRYLFVVTIDPVPSGGELVRIVRK